MSVTVNKIKLLLPDNVLIALTDDQETGAINETLINQIISDGTAFIRSVAPDAASAIQDEFVKNYVLAFLYKYAGLDEPALNYQRLYTQILETLKPDKATTAGQIYVNSADRVFTGEELEEW